ncbi:MAG: ABC transporter permease [Deltaproteobacteria bacterium]|nr:ABC transporter permease [Deltaproteobacteria bacterium]
MKIDIKIAWRNVWRNSRRSLMTMGAIAFATTLLVFMLSWQFGSYDTMINSAVRTYYGHVQVQPKGYLEKKDIRLVVADPDEIGAFLKEIPGVTAHTFRGNAFSLLSSKARTYGALVIGIDPVRESRVSTIKQLIRKGHYLSEGDENRALLGQLLARNLRVSVGDEVVVLGQGRDGSIAATVVKVKGIYSSGQDVSDRSFIQIPLKTFQEVYSMGKAVHEVVVLCKDLDRVQAVRATLASYIERLGGKDDLVVLDWKELMPGLIQAIRMDLFSGFIMYILLIIVVAFSILNTFLMAIFERTREFGVLMAIGTKPGRLTKILLMESGVLTLSGILVGVLSGCLVTYYFQIHGIYVSEASDLLRQYGLPERMYPRLSMLSVSIGSGIVLAITLITALYPAFKVHGVRPIEAMAAN